MCVVISRYSSSEYTSSSSSSRNGGVIPSATPSVAQIPEVVLSTNLGVLRVVSCFFHDGRFDNMANPIRSFLDPLTIGCMLMLITYCTQAPFCLLPRANIHSFIHSFV
uniref:Uncharacterized protein n=1 Tax=Grammatophora oceanica TaxID=210454 RepID=A0A7S1UPF6_9STRA|mmetsp:Transcript_15940/g.23518  ORF Transcript_15940/g.23518 Transcript_15940/m.23518 type:complete len:108 (+) Transcript_15940:333-656(+)